MKQIKLPKGGWRSWLWMRFLLDVPPVIWEEQVKTAGHEEVMPRLDRWWIHWLEKFEHLHGIRAGMEAGGGSAKRLNPRNRDFSDLSTRWR